MKTKISYSSSETQNTTSGAPQGSALISLLFLIFRNDLPNDIKSEIKLFGDNVEQFIRNKQHKWSK